VTADEFRRWVEEAEPRMVLLYMQADCASRCPELAREAMRCAEEGLVFLYQVKVTDGVYNYMARRLDWFSGRRLRPWGY
jgi:hypothetical protein